MFTVIPRRLIREQFQLELRFELKFTVPSALVTAFNSFLLDAGQWLANTGAFRAVLSSCLAPASGGGSTTTTQSIARMLREKVV